MTVIWQQQSPLGLWPPLSEALRGPCAVEHHALLVQSDHMVFRFLLSLLREKEYRATASTKGIISLNLEVISRY